MSRMIDADALIEILTTAIRNMKGVAKFIGAEDDPELNMEIKAYNDILNGVKEQTTIEPEPQWIPCSERLPEKEGWYFVTVHPDYIVPDSMHTDSLYWLDGKWWFFDYDAQMAVWLDPIIAWMPLPEPYKGVER